MPGLDPEQTWLNSTFYILPLWQSTTDNLSDTLSNQLCTQSIIVSSRPRCCGLLMRMSHATILKTLVMVRFVTATFPLFLKPVTLLKVEIRSVQHNLFLTNPHGLLVLAATWSSCCCDLLSSRCLWNVYLFQNFCKAWRQVRIISHPSPPTNQNKPTKQTKQKKREKKCLLALTVYSL